MTALSNFDREEAPEQLALEYVRLHATPDDTPEKLFSLYCEAKIRITRFIQSGQNALDKYQF